MMLDNAREQGVEVHQRRACWRCSSRASGPSACAIQKEDGAQEEVRAKVVVDASGQSTMLQNRFKLRLWDPVLNKGAIWTYWQGAYRDTRPGRGRHPGRADARTSRAGSGTSRSTTTPSASAWWRRSTICSRAAAATSRPTTRRWKRAPPSRSASSMAGARPATSPPRTIRIARSRSPATAGC